MVNRYKTHIIKKIKKTLDRLNDKYSKYFMIPTMERLAMKEILNTRRVYDYVELESYRK